MSAELDMSTGRAGIAYMGETPWHGMGTNMAAGQSMEAWQEAAGLNWHARTATVEFAVPRSTGDVVYSDTNRYRLPGRVVIYRSDTLAGLGVVSDRYQPVQPAQVIHFYDDLCDRYGYAIETMGSLKGGKVIWALANTGVADRIGGVDDLRAYVLLTTSYDGSSATQARFTSVRVVCANTLAMAMGENGKAISVRHNTDFDAAKVKADLGIGSTWAAHAELLGRLAETQVDAQAQVNFLLSVYHDMTSKSVEASKPHVERTMKRLATVLNTAPGATLPTAYGTLYGLLNAVTYDVDHSQRARSDDSRLASAWMGNGDALKTKALQLAANLIGA